MEEEPKALDFCDSFEKYWDLLCCGYVVLLCEDDTKMHKGAAAKINAMQTKNGFTTLL